jgi:Phage integrase SAM-like domain
MRRKTDYLFLRPGSQNWHIKLQSPTGRVERSLRTPDRRQAEVLALPLIAEHRAALLATRPRLEPSWHHEYEPGREHVGPDGGRIVATERELIYLDTNGVITSRAPNGEATLRVTGRKAERLVRSLVKTFAKAYVEAEGRGEQPTARSLIRGFKSRPAVAVKNSDDVIFETYIKHADVTGYYEREARSMWALYRTLTDSKPLADATRDDGRKLVAYLEGQGLKSASIRKKIMWLNAAVNLAIDEGRLKFNPFAKIVPDRKDAAKRLPLDEADIKACERNLRQLEKSEQLLFRLLAATGMRLSEAFEVDSELKERGVRYVVVGHKTEQ